MAPRPTSRRPAPGELLVIVVVLTLAAPTRAQQYTVSEEEDGARPTVYTLRNNWSQPPGRDYHNTTMIGDGASGCGEFPCLDDGEAGDLPPNGKRNGTATAVITGMVAGTYQVEFFFRQSDNRSSSVPWRLFSDAATNNTRAANLNQRDAATWGTDEGWRVLDGTDTRPISVASRLTFVFGSDTLTFTGSISYGGIRATRIAASAVDAGRSDAAGASGCQAIASHTGYELCASTATTCSGVYTNGDGCTAFCAAAGMQCRARYGASPGCSKEPEYPIACAEVNSHLSDWCDCALPQAPDAAVADSARPPTADAAPVDRAAPDAGVPDRPGVDVRADDATGPDAGAADLATLDALDPDTDGADATIADRGTADRADPPGDAGADGDAVSAAVDAGPAAEEPVDYVGVAGCSCRAHGRSRPSPWLLLAAAVAVLCRRCGQTATRPASRRRGRAARSC